MQKHLNRTSKGDNGGTMLKTHDYLRGFIRLAVVAGLLLAAWTFVFLAIYGAVRLAERLGLC